VRIGTLLIGFLFDSPAALLATALAAVSVPILIHFINRRRFRVVRWAAIRFLLEANRESLRRIRMHQFLLLLVRTCVVLSLMLAMASVMPWANELVWPPFFRSEPAEAPARSERTHRILVLDGSFSMGARIADRSFFERAQAAAVRILQESPSGDGFSALLMAGQPRRIVSHPSENAMAVAREIDALRLPHGTADLLATLNSIHDLLRHSPEKFEAREVYFFTDLGRSTWMAPQAADAAALMHKIQARARIVLVDAGQEGINNVAVTGLVVSDFLPTVGSPTAITAEIHNYGSELRRQTRMEFLVGRGRRTASDPEFGLRLAQEQLIDVAPGETASVTFSHRFDAPGDYAVQVRSEGDALEIDDTRAAIVSVRDAVPVLLINGKAGAERYEQATQWLKDALNPFPAGTMPDETPAQPRVISEASFADIGLSDLMKFDCIFICDVSRLTNGTIRRMETYLRQGGGVVFCLGPHVDLSAYNQLLYRDGTGPLPARLLGYEEAARDVFFSFRADEEAYRRPPLDAFAADRDRNSLTRARFRRYVRTVLPSRTQARTILAFAPWATTGPESPSAPEAKPVSSISTQPVSDPAIVVASHGRGQVVLLTSTVNMDWGTWPASPSFPAFMQELLRFAVAGRTAGRALEVGEPLEEILPPGTGTLDVLVHTPDGRSEKTHVEDRNEAATLHWTDTDASGIYRAVVGNDARDHLFAVNAPAAIETLHGCESDLARTRPEELQGVYPGWEFELVADPEHIHPSAATPTAAPRPGEQEPGARIATFLLLAMSGFSIFELMLAWYFGRTGATGDDLARSRPARPILALSMATCAVIIASAAALVLANEAVTGDLLGLFPGPIRQAMETHWLVPASVSELRTHCRLEYLPWNRTIGNASWLTAGILLASLVLVLALYRSERCRLQRAGLLSLLTLRIIFVLLTLGVLLPQLRLLFERQSLPDVVIVIDDSTSMNASDQSMVSGTPSMVDRSLRMSPKSAIDRLEAAKNLVTRARPDWVETVLDRLQCKLHVYRCSSRAEEIANAADVSQHLAAIQAIRGLRAEGNSSRLGACVREVLDDFKGGSLGAVIMLTDGITTEGEDLVQVAAYAAQLKVPLFFVGLGDWREPHELKLHDLQTADSAYMNDRIVFEARLTASGFANVSVPVMLRDKDTGAILSTQMVHLGAQGKSARVRLAHRPTTPGEKTYVIEVPRQAQQTNPQEECRLERTIFIRESRTSKVLYVEGYARYEYRYLKNLLEREGAGDSGNKLVDLRVLLLDADEEYARIDRSALADFPSKRELDQYDVVIIGDVDPGDRRVADHWKDVSGFVRERGGGLLFIAGERYAPQAFRGTPLQAVLPVDSRPPTRGDDEPVSEFRPEPTIAGRLHPALRLNPDEAENAAIWGRLPPLHWCSRCYGAKPGTEVLAVQSAMKSSQEARRTEAEERHPLIVQQFIGAGRVLFFGFDQTWRWRFRNTESLYNQFWLQTVRFLARSRSQHVELSLDRQTPYRRGDPIQLTVRFPEDAPIPASEVKVLVERRAVLPDGSEEVESQTVVPGKVGAARGTYEGRVSPTPEGSYRFRLVAPTGAGETGHVECRVLPPPGEMDRLLMDRAAMQRAAEISQGRFYTVADAEGLLEDLPPGTRVTLNATRPPLLLWNQPVVFIFALGILGSEWFLRRQMHLL
jgi:uncharacterized membrane protein